MNWTISAIGKARPVAAKIAADIAKHKVLEPGEAIKQAVGALLAETLAAQHPDSAVKVTASGIHSSAMGSDGHSKPTYTLILAVEPLTGFTE